LWFSFAASRRRWVLGSLRPFWRVGFGLVLVAAAVFALVFLYQNLKFLLSKI
jgi:hypothetical protein